MAVKTIFVRAKKGCACPRRVPGTPPITDMKIEEVPAESFYLRLVMDGSLVICKKETEKKPSPKEAEK